MCGYTRGEVVAVTSGSVTRTIIRRRRCDATRRDTAAARQSQLYATATRADLIAALSHEDDNDMG